MHDGRDAYQRPGDVLEPLIRTYPAEREQGERGTLVQLCPWQVQLRQYGQALSDVGMH